MFQNTLDNAKVLYYTDGKVADYIKYLAICKYQNRKEEYYLFRCDENFEVVGDSVWNSIEECMEVANTSYNGNIIWIEVK